MPQDGITPDLVTWNSLLRARGKAGDIDGAFRCTRTGVHMLHQELQNEQVSLLGRPKG